MLQGLERILLISIHTHLKYSTREPCSLLLQIEAAQEDTQRCEANLRTIQPDIDWRVIAGEEDIGFRRWGVVDGTFDCTYQAQVRVERPDVQLETLRATDFGTLPNDVTKFLMPSRYCYPEDFLEFVPRQFGSLPGGRLIAGMSNWIKDHFTYDICASSGSTTATDSFNARAGVCRDYAHVLIAMSRSVGIPARLVSAYGPNVLPQDFHAVAEVFLDGYWHLVDPTGMTQASEIVRIGVGRDAADVSFMTSYGYMEMIKQSVQVSRIA
ncbi:Transglutaminase-like superfamily protein [Litoreibacter ascidiaceicola]|uniref:Transglutaminase-like superfamily protein n=2 Tax=Litoreibacter ascidiaceicola TaxID=1486859 RepID=A0A1M5E8I5_9RHOB|nr:Transglutaminase-like superfamily protein [Litoreibacter ascidiaceicola]